MYETQIPPLIASRYRVIEQIGKGSVGKVFRVQHVHTGDELALKVLLDQAGADPGIVERFKREARAPALIRSEHVVKITDADVAPELGGAPFLVMELLEGSDLEDHLAARGRLPPAEVVEILAQVALALDRAHAVGIVHRDLKPANVFLHRRAAGSIVKVLDFGISKMAREGSGGMAEAGLTASGSVIGTPAYMAPEQALGRVEDVGPGTDVWATGLIAFKLLTGRHYWLASTMAELMVEILTGTMAAATERARHLPPAFDEWFERSCARDPGERWRSAGEQIEALARALSVPLPDPRAASVSSSGAGLPDPSSETIPSSSVAATPARRPAAPVDVGEGERRQITVVFIGVTASSTRGDEVDPEDLGEAMREYQSACAEVLGSMGGPITQTMGDGQIAYFGYPIAHGDDARRAVSAGLAIADACTKLNARLRREIGVELAVRIGIHTGLVVAGDSGPASNPRAIVGQAPQIASQLQQLAEPNTVALSAATHRLVGGHFACERVEARLRAAPDGEIFRAVSESAGAADATRAADTPLVGRDAELGLLLSRWEDVKSGAGHVALVVGEAGIGKSRLVKAFRAGLAGDRFQWVESRCSPYFANTALRPVIDMLQRLTGILRGDSGPERLEKLERALRPFTLPQDALALLAGLLSVPVATAPLNLTPQRQKQKTHEAVLALLTEMSAKEPLVFVMDDLHWADPSTLELLALIVDHGPSTAFMTLLTARPDFHAPWTTRSHLSQITLSKLPRKRIEAMVLELTGQKPMPAEILDQLAARTDGVPLFVEELTKMVLESGLVRDAGARYELTGPLPPLAIPATLRDSLTARLDRLGRSKVTAQLAATIGREFSYELLRAISPLDDATLEEDLARLVSCELIYQRGLIPRATYTFKHILVQDAAYESLLKNTRRQGHERIAEVLLDRFPEMNETQPELLAHHFAAAGMAAPAAGHLLRAGQKALEKSANAEAIGHLSRGIDLVTELPDSSERARLELALRTVLGVPLMFTKGYGAPEVEQAYAAAHALGKKVGVGDELLPALWGLWIFYHVRGHYRTALGLTDQLVELAKGSCDPGVRLCAELARGCTSLLLGDLTQARSHLERTRELYQAEQHRSHAHLFGQDPSVFAGVMLSWNLWLLGRPDEALQAGERALAYAKKLDHPNTLGFALAIVGGLHQYRGDRDLAEARSSELVALSGEQGLLHWLGLGHMLHGWAIKERGAIEEGIAEMREGRAMWRMIGARVADSHWDSFIAESLAEAGRADEGLALIRETRAWVEESDERDFDAELHRVEGELLLAATGDARSAEAMFRRAMAVAAAGGSRAHELKAAVSLARVLEKRGDKAAGRAILAPMLANFTEGFTTRDLLAAKALLDA